MRYLWPAIVLLLGPVLPALAEDRPAKGMFLVADRELQDPNFARSVVLLVDYGEHGAAGVIVNRRTDARLVDLLPETPGAEQVAGRVFLGGPVSPEGVLVLLRAEEPPEAARPVFDDVYVSSSREILEDLVRDGATFRVFVGYAGWAPGQLDWELRQGGWSVLPADVETVFDEAPEDVWRKMMRRATSPLASAPSKPSLRIGLLGPTPPCQGRSRCARPALDPSLRVVPMPEQHTPDDWLRTLASVGFPAHGTGAQPALAALPPLPGGVRGVLGEGRPGAEARGGEGQASR